MIDLERAETGMVPRGGVSALMSYLHLTPVCCSVMQELEILRLIESKFIVELKLAFSQAGYLYMALEYMAGT